MNNLPLVFVCLTLAVALFFAGRSYGRAEVQSEYAQAAAARLEKATYVADSAKLAKKLNDGAKDIEGDDFNVVLTGVRRMHDTVRPQ